MAICRIFLLSLLPVLLPIAVLASGSIEIVFAGDAMMHERQLNAARQKDGSYDFSPYYKAITPYIQSADYAVVNLELPLGGAPYSGYPIFCAPDSYIEPLKDAGFDLFLNANNHILDRRDKGLRRTIATLDRNKIPHIGAYSNAAQRDSILPFISDIKGFKVAFLNYTYGTNGIPVQGNVVVDYIDRNKITADIATARRKGAEIITVCMHWGDEYKLLPVQSERSLASFLKSQGVDLIIGGHPHVIQPMELTFDRQQRKNIFTCYSLGNFISAMRKTDTSGGCMVRVKLSRDRQGKAIVESASYRMIFVLPPDNNVNNYRLVSAETVVDQSMEEARKAFVGSVRNIFDRYNVNVPLDTLTIDEYKARLSVPSPLRHLFNLFGY